MEISNELKEGLEALEDLSEYRQIDLRFDRSKHCWVLHFSLCPSIFPNDYVAATTNWFGLISRNYPYGTLEFYPDRTDGLRHTFPHQLYNRDPGKGFWRDGNLCVRTKLASWEQRGFDREPQTAPNRLRWHMERALYWLECAATNRLTQPGDPFELPHVPVGAKNKVVFLETREQFPFWMRSPRRTGRVSGRLLPNSEIVVVGEFSVGEERLFYSWGKYLSDKGRDIEGIWIRLDFVPVGHPWEVPLHWSELSKIGDEQGQAIILLLQQEFLRKGKGLPEFILIGFPLPKDVGGPAEQLHWFGCLFPDLPSINGFRANSPAYWESAAKRMFGGNKIKWMVSENWAKEQISGRGLLHPAVINKKVLLIGAGAVGSLVAELITRLGVKEAVLLDRDNLTVGNFSRHTLTMSDLSMQKAEGVAKRLNAIFPDVAAHYFNQSLDERLAQEPNFIKDFDLVIEATGADEVLHILESTLSPGQQLVSLSTGLQAHRLYAFCAGSFTNLKAIFDEKMSAWLEKEVREKEGLELPMEGLGCWHPLFPARYDSIMLLVAGAIPCVEEYLSSNKSEPHLVVLEKQFDGENFAGVKIVNEAS